MWILTHFACGFFFCEIEAPLHLEHPILQTHLKTEFGYRTVAPVGTWKDMIFSAEMDNAIKYGYKFKILSGYTFDKGIIFDGYIDQLYNLRLQYPKTDPMNYIAKLLMNSLYGRFGMEDRFNDIQFMSNTQFNEFESKHGPDVIEDIINVGDDNKIVIYRLTEKDDKNALNANFEYHSVNVGIASAITAYARILMSEFKNNPDIKLFYTDTDSAYVQGALPDRLVSNTILGKFKLEHIAKRAVFLGPKFYILELEDGCLITKIKGLNKTAVPLTFEDFTSLLNKDNKLERMQTKWFKSIGEGTITLKDQLYTLKLSGGKRNLVYNDNDILTHTTPIVLQNGKIVSPCPALADAEDKFLIQTPILLAACGLR